MLNHSQIFKITVGILLGILGFFVGMVFIGILLMAIFGMNDILIPVGGILGGIISILIGFKVFIKTPGKKGIPQTQHKQAKYN